MYVDVPDMRPVSLLCRSVIVTWDINWISFVHMVVEGSQFMIGMNVAGGVYDYASFLVLQDTNYEWEKEAVDRTSNPSGEDQDEVVDAPAVNIF